MQLVDIGANLTHPAFAHDLDAVIQAAAVAGVAHIIVTGTDLDSSLAAAALAHSRPHYFSSTAGFHPHVASTCTAAAMEQIRELAQTQELVAIGETGLDFNRDYSPRPVQLAVFEQHLQLAATLQKPLFLHQRDAHSDFVGLLQQYRPHISGGVVHCFTDNEQALYDYLDLDMYIGITGWICDERRGQLLQQLAAKIPADRLLIETDAPYLLPRTLSVHRKPRRNEPQYLLQVLQSLAACRGCSPEIVAAQTSENAQRLFGIRLTAKDK